MKSRLPQFCVLLLVLCAALLMDVPDSLHRENPSPPHDLGPGAAVRLPASDAFASWLAAWGSAADLEKAVVAQGVALAIEREEEMLTLIQNAPREALAKAVSFSDYVRLPAEVRAHVERPFSATAELLALPVCSSQPGKLGVSQTIDHQLIMAGERFAASVFGRRSPIMTKEGTPLQGITLAGVAAVREEVFQVVEAQDARFFPEAQAATDRCFASGERLGPGAVTALAGGRQFHFASAELLGAFDERVGEFDQEPGPHSGSRVIFLMADGAAGDGAGFDWAVAQGEVELQASAWTETPKDVYFIRVDFSDVAGESISQASLDSLLNTTVSDTIADMSYGKTEINATVSPIVVRLPSPTSSYKPSDNNALHDDAKVAAEAQISGLNLDDYDIVGVHFGSIGIESSGGTNYVGLAGGSRMWIQGTSSSNVFIHEFGHNYGIGHASFWATTDGSVVGTGASDEYGDDFDIMGDGPNSAHFHMQAKQHLDWLEPAQWTDVTGAGSGTFRVYRFDDPATNGVSRGLRITKAASPMEYYWLGYRRNLSDNQWLQAGAYLLWQRPSSDRCWLLDTTPGSANGRDDGMILPGKTYSDTGAGVHITTVATGGSAPDDWIDVTVNLGGFGSNTAPTATLGGPMAVNARESISYSVSGDDLDGDELAYFWDFGDSTIATNTASQTRSWAVGGSYPISVTVSDMKGGTVTEMQTVTVSDPLDSWTQRTSGTAADLFDIATDGSNLVAVGSGSGTYRTSTDGVTWGGGTIGINIYLRGIVWDGAQFLAAGQDYEFSAPAGWRGAIYTSPDGTSWTERHFAGAELRDIATSGSVHVAVGDNGEIWRSTNGTTWSPIPSGTSIDLKGVSYGGGKFVAVGSGSPENAGGPVVVLTSTDGNSWTDTSAGVNILSWQGFYDVQYCNDRFLASGFRSKIQHSTDGGTSFATTRADDEEIPGFAFGNGIYLAAGEDNENGDMPINLISTDGETWSKLSTNTAQADRNGAVFFENTFITVADGGQIWQSNPFSAPSGIGGFAVWLDGFFPGSTPASAALLDDDGDGNNHLQEYASGTDPTSATSAIVPVAAEVGGYLQLAVTKNPAATDVIYNVEISTDLENWSTLATVVVSDDASSLVVRSSTLVTDPATTREFLRAVYTLVE